MIADTRIQSNSVTHQHISCERFQLAFKQALPEAPLLSINLSVDTIKQRITQQCIYAFRTWLLAKTHVTETQDIPTSWWQHWKRDHAPRWLTRRWPVHTERLYLKVVHVCPHSTERWQDAREPHVAFLIQRNSLFP